MIVGTSTGCATRAPIGRSETVVIVGSGMAGVAAAHNLEASGYGVVILEARERIGGRIFTDRSMGAPVDLGASRIHGSTRNPITGLAQRYGAHSESVDWRNLVGFDEDGTPLEQKKVSHARDDLTSVLRRAYLKGLGRGEDVSVEEIVARQTKGRKFGRADRRTFEFSLASFEILTSAPLRELSWQYGKEYNEYGGGDHIVTNGYDNVIRGYGAVLDIRTGVRVSKIRYHASGVDVETTAGKVSADRVIVTVPLGVLKANTIVFEPELPAEKYEAIQRVGMGLINKVALHFPRAFWPRDPHALVHAADTRGHFPVFINLYRYTSEPILVAIIPMSFANALEGMSERDATAMALDVLRGMYGSSVPDPDGAVQTRWGSEPYTRGAYSYNRLGGSGQDRETLAEAVAGRVFFAGEATHRRMYGSVAGAYHSGVRAAKEVIRSASLAFS